MGPERAPEPVAPWERSLRELTEVVRQGMAHLCHAEATLVRTGDPESVADDLNAAMACGRGARTGMDSLMAQLAEPDDRRIVAQAVSKSTIEVLVQSFFLYLMSLDLVVRAAGLGARDHCGRALRLAKEFARSSMLLLKDSPSFEQRHMLEAVQALNTFRRDFDDRFVPIFDRITDVYHRLDPENAVVLLEG